MRVLMISDVYFPRVNGVSTSIQTFRRQFEQMGHETCLIAPDYGRPYSDPWQTLRIPAHSVPLDPEDRRMRWRAVFEHLPMLRDARFDLVHIQTPFVAHYAGVALARQLGLPRVETYHTFFEEYLYHYVPFVPKPWMRALARRFSRQQCNRLNAVVVPSCAMHDVLRSYRVNVPIEIIPTGMEMDQLSGGDGAQFRERHKIAPERPVLVHVGRIAFEKNIDFLLRVLLRVRASVPDVLLVVAGEGPALAWLRKLTARLHLDNNVLFVGYQDRKQALLDCYRAGDVFVFASHTETQGLVLLEAMALGVPVVAAAILGTRDILEPARGALVAAADEQDFAEKILRLLGDKALRERMGREGTQYAQEWSARRMAERMVTFYQSVIQHSARRLPARQPISASESKA